MSISLSRRDVLSVHLKEKTDFNGEITVLDLGSRPIDEDGEESTTPRQSMLVRLGRLLLFHNRQCRMRQDAQSIDEEATAVPGKSDRRTILSIFQGYILISIFVLW